jgi:hypothetical protein
MHAKPKMINALSLAKNASKLALIVYLPVKNACNCNHKHNSLSAYSILE